MNEEDKHQGCFKSGVLGCFGLLIFCLLVYLGLVLVGAVLIVADPVQPVDAVVVLSGDDGERLDLAIEMHENGLAPNLVITDTSQQANDLLIQQALESGFLRQDIYVTDMQVGSTVDEAIAVRDFAQNRNWDSLMIVTDPFHSFRTRFIFRRELRGSGIQLYIRPVVGHWYRSTSWFLYAEGWKFTFLEITKFTSYLFLGR